MKSINTEEFILSVLSPRERLEAGMRIAREAFQNTALTIEDIEAAVQKVRRKHYGSRQKKAASRR